MTLSFLYHDNYKVFGEIDALDEILGHNKTANSQIAVNSGQRQQNKTIPSQNKKFNKLQCLNWNDSIKT